MNKQENNVKSFHEYLFKLLNFSMKKILTKLKFRENLNYHFLVVLAFC